MYLGPFEEGFLGEVDEPHRTRAQVMLETASHLGAFESKSFRKRAPNEAWPQDTDSFETP